MLKSAAIFTVNSISVAHCRNHHGGASYCW